MSNLIHLNSKSASNNKISKFIRYSQNHQNWQELFQLINDIKNQLNRYAEESGPTLPEPKSQILQSLEAKLELLNQEISKHKEQETYLLKLNEKLHRFATIDRLTKVANRYCFDQYLDHEWHRLTRCQKPLSLIFCDLDFFKQYNDEYGHPAGDECLQKVAQTIRKTVKRSTDLVARYGGEEFVVILPETDLSGAIKVATNIRTAVEQLQIRHSQSRISKYVTLSLGVASIIPTQTASPENLIEQADTKLYEAKQSGRNCIKYASISENFQPNPSKKISFTLKGIKNINRTIMIHWSFEEKSLIRIGRAADNDVVLYHPLVSRHHLKLQWVGQGWQLQSFGQNGTYINGREVEQAVVNGGEIIKLARFGPALQIDLVNSE